MNFTANQLQIINWAKQLKNHKRTVELKLDWEWTNSGKKSACVFQKYIDAGSPRSSRTLVFTASIDKFDEKFEAAKRLIEE